jgi:hypothetical protein
VFSIFGKKKGKEINKHEKYMEKSFVVIDYFLTPFENALKYLKFYKIL